MASPKSGTVVIALLTLLLVGVLAMALRGLVTGPARAPAAPDPPALTGEDYDTALAAAEAFVRDNRPEEAVRVLERVITVYPDRQTARIALAEARRLMGQLDQSLEQYAAAIRIGPAGAPLLFNAGNVADDAGKIEQAIDYFNRAQFADPKEPRYPLWLAQVQIKAGQESAARVSLVRVVNIDPAQAIAWGTLAQLELKDNNLDLAWQHVSEARKHEPDSLAWRVLAARILNRQNKPKDALDLLQGLPATDRLKPGVLQAMSQSLGLLKQPEAAAKLYQDAAELAPREPEWAYQAAVWLDRAGDKAAARVWALRASNLGHEKARELAARLAP